MTISGCFGLKVNSSYQKPSFKSRIHKISYSLEHVSEGRSYKNQVIGIELNLEALTQGRLIHLALAKVDTHGPESVGIYWN